MRLIISLGIFLAFVPENRAKVLELSDRFLPLKHEGMWLIMFYAPWCGHCKKLEPIWKHVDQSISGKLPVRVGRIDCTRFTNVATEFKIQGFPTILFIKGDTTYSYDGDRTREDLVSFATRLVGPPVNRINKIEDFSTAKKTSEIFFVFAGDQDEYDEKWVNYQRVAKMFQQHDFFYQAPADLASRFSGFEESGSIRVYKDDTSFVYRDEPEALAVGSGDDGGHGEMLERWIQSERFPQFTKVTRGRMGHLLSTGKLLVMAVLEENKLGELTPDMEMFRDMLTGVVANHIDRYRSRFQFGWTGSPDLANSIAMDTLSIPHILVMNTTSYQHYLPDDEPMKMTPDAVTIFLDNILDGSAPVYGGSSYTVNLYRALFEAKVSIIEMWKGNPALTSVIFGLPLGFFALICYSTCCADIMDAEEEEEDENPAECDHEKTD